MQHECRVCARKLHSICSSNFGDDAVEHTGYICPQCSKRTVGEGSAATTAKRSAEFPARSERSSRSRGRLLPAPPARASSSVLNTPQKERAAGQRAIARDRRLRRQQPAVPQPAPVSAGTAGARRLTTPQRERAVGQHGIAKERKGRSRLQGLHVAHIEAGKVSDSSDSQSSPPSSPVHGPATPVARRLRQRASAPDSPSKGANKRGKQRRSPSPRDAGSVGAPANTASPVSARRPRRSKSGRPRTATVGNTHGRRRRCACGRTHCHLDAPRDYVKVVVTDVAPFHSAIAPGVPVAEWQAKAAKLSLYLAKRHWRRDAFSVSRSRVSLLRDGDGSAPAPTREYQMEPGQLARLFYQQQTGMAGNPQPQPGHLACPCWSARCSDQLNLRQTGMFKAPSDKVGRDAWCRVLMPASSAERKEHKEARTQFRSLGRTVYVSALHFNAADLHKKSRNHSVKPGATPMLHPRETTTAGSAGDAGVANHDASGSEAEAACAEARKESEERATVMAAVLEALDGQTLGGEEDARHAAERVADVIDDMMGAERDTTPGAGCDAPDDEPDPAAPRLKRVFLAMLKARPALCLYYTGEISWAAITGLFSWMNADGAFEELRIVADASAGGEGQAPRKRAGRAKAGTPLEQFVFWLCVFRRFKSHMQHAGLLFDVSESTAHRWYGAWCNSIARFSAAMFPPELLTHEKMVQATSATTIDRLKMTKGEGVILGDCTERWVDDCKSRATHKAFFSEYKHHPTTMQLVLADGSSYIWHIVEPYCGASTDNAILELACVPDKMPRRPDGTTGAVLNFDRGLTNDTPFLRKGVRVVTGDSKREGQMAYEGNKMDDSRASATSRIHIERIMLELNSYAGFKDQIGLESVDLGVSECECARFLVNLKPRNHNWTETSHTEDEDAAAGGAVDTPATPDAGVPVTPSGVEGWFLA